MLAVNDPAIVRSCDVCVGPPSVATGHAALCHDIAARRAVMSCAVTLLSCRLLEHGAKDSSELQMLVAPMSDEELLQVIGEEAWGSCVSLGQSSSFQSRVCQFEQQLEQQQQ